jgi:short-subunit dehydrogenase
MTRSIQKGVRRLYARKGSAPLALITGGSSGMGKVYAEQLAGCGCDVLLVSNQKELLSSCESQLSDRYGVQVYSYYCDLTDLHAPQALFDYCQSLQLQVDILINNAGMFFFKELDYQNDKARVNAIMKLHIDSITHACLLFGEQMKARGYGYILNVSSMTASLPVPGLTLYSATKAYLKSFSSSYYFEMRPYGVGVTVVCPAAVATPLYNIKEFWMKWGLRTGVINSPQWLVKRALKGLFRKRKIVRPGLLNYLVPALIHLFPNALVSYLWKKIK